jgi:hypothetical protein
VKERRRTFLLAGGFADPLIASLRSALLPGGEKRESVALSGDL